MEQYKIDEVANQTGLTKRAIRYYEQIGLISPPGRTEGGTRVYSSHDIARLEKIVNAKEVLGFSLQELQHFLSLREQIELYREKKNHGENDRSDLEDLANHLKEQIDQIDSKINKMEQFKAEINDMYSRAQDVLNDD